MGGGRGGGGGGGGDAAPLAESESGVFAIRASEVVWDEYWQKLPKRNYHDLFSMFSSGLATIDGDLTIFMQNLIYFKLLFAAPRNCLRELPSAK